MCSKAGGSPCRDRRRRSPAIPASLPPISAARDCSTGKDPNTRRRPADRRRHCRRLPGRQGLHRHAAHHRRSQDRCRCRLDDSRRRGADWCDRRDVGQHGPATPRCRPRPNLRPCRHRHRQRDWRDCSGCSHPHLLTRHRRPRAPRHRAGYPRSFAANLAPRDRDLMLAIWGSYMPIGTVLMLLLGPALPEIGWGTLWAFNAILPIAYAALCFLRFGLGERGPLGTSPLSDIEALFQRAHRFIWHWLSDSTLSLMSRLPGSCRSSLSRNCICLSLPRACSRRLLSRRMSSAIIMAGGFLPRRGPLLGKVAMSFTVYGIVSLVIFASGVGGGVIAMTAAITLGIGGLSPGSIFAGVPRFAPNPRRASSPQADATGTRDCQSSPIMTRLAGRLYSGGPHSSSRLPCRAASRVES